MSQAAAYTSALILVVDDDRLQQTLASKVLNRFNYRVICASSGAEALTLAGNEQPELILLDVDMPGMDGFTTCRQLKSQPETSAIPIIFVTSRNDPADRVQGFAAGASDYISKPIHAGELSARVSTHTALRRRINDLSRLKNALWKSEVRYRLFVENTPDLFWEVDANLNIVYVSPQSRALIGLAPAELIGKPVDHIFAGNTDWLNLLLEKSGLSQFTSIEVTTAHADGSPLILDVNASVLRNDDGDAISILGVARNITERKANERRLQQLSLAVESSPVSVAISDVAGRIESVNPAFCQLTGYLEAEIIGQEMKILRSGVHPESFFDALWAQLCQGESLRYEFCNRRKDGSIYWVHQAISPIFNNEGKISHFVWVGEDFTEARQQEQRLREAKEAAEKATQAKSDFLANMSHEIRTPMNAIIGLSHLCLKTRLDPKQLDYLTNISSAARSLLAIINDILDFSKIEAGRMQLESTPFDLTSVFAHIANLSMPKAREKNLSLVFRLAPEVPLALRGDPTRLGQILLNLCSNAIKFTEHGEIRVECQLRELRQQHAHLRFTVIDSGIGMDEAQRQRLFSPFVQADTSTTRKYGGTGLGLTISKQIVEAMGGQIAVDSEPGRGTCFTCDLPLAVIALDERSTARLEEKAASPSLHNASHPLSEAELLPLRGLRVLLVEDNKFNQQVATDLLELVGVRVQVAGNGCEAIEQLRKSRFDIVLMDLQMPVMDGLTATRQLRETYPPDTLPIIAMTANALAGDRERCLAAGMNAHIGKPIEPDDLYGQLLVWQKIGARHTHSSPPPAVTHNENPASPSAPPFDLPGFDTELALSRMRGNIAHYTRMLGLFVNEFGDFADRIQAALAAGDRVTTKRLAHTLKGSAGTMGANDLQNRAAELNQLLESGDDAAIARSLAGLSAALQQAVDKITALQAGQA